MMKTSPFGLIAATVFFSFLLIIPGIAYTQCIDPIDLSNFTEQTASEFDLNGSAIVYFAETTDVNPDILIVELYSGWGGPSSPGIYRIEVDPVNANYSTCHTCILILENIDWDTGIPERTFFATSGELNIDSIGPVGEQFTGVLADVQLIEVTIDPDTFESIPVPGGQTRCIDSFPFDTPITGEGPVGDSDGDRLSDDDELIYGTDPLNPDTDYDMLWDGDEVFFYGTDPLIQDTDGGGVADGQEVSDGTNPLNPTDDLVPIDEDNDGFPLGPDCNDNDPSINPNAEEIWYDGIDQNCDGNDTDQDFDGYPIEQDCDDTNILMSPGLSEFCDGYDNNCDGSIDEQGPCIAVHLTWYTPADPDETDNFGSDLDLHFLHPNGEWWEFPWDCFWQNRNPHWGDLNDRLDDPNLSRDDTDGLGPEVVELPNPETGAIYKVGVHYFSTHGFGPSYPTVKVFVNGQMTFEEIGQPLNDREFWEVATIDWDSGVVTSLSDLDGDGIPNDMDSCPSSDLSETIIIDDCDTGVINHMVADGCTISDRIAACATGAKNHGKFVSCVSHLTNALKKDKVISGKEKGAIQSCAAQADIP